VSNASGHAKPTLKCVNANCGKLFSVAVGFKGKLETRPDPFRAKCPYCQRTEPYPEAAVQHLYDTGP
jgi:aspartate carbamoyltransferase regulatory subunit